MISRADKRMSTDSGANATSFNDNPTRQVNGAKRRGRKRKNVVVGGKDGVHRRQSLAEECAAGSLTTQQQHDLGDLAVA